jgi:hypothetical protein
MDESWNNGARRNCLLVGIGKIKQVLRQWILPQGSVLVPVLYSLYINDDPVSPGTHLALSADDTCIYATEKHERCVLCWLQQGLPAVNFWCECWNMKINEGKTQTIYFSRRLRIPDDVLLLNGWDIPFVNNVMYLGVTFNRRMTWRHHTERTVAKALHTYVRTYSLFKSWRLSTNVKLMLYKALIRSVMTYACPPGSMRRTLTSWYCSACRTEYSALLENLTGAHRAANCTWLSKFLTCMTI